MLQLAKVRRVRLDAARSLLTVTVVSPPPYNKQLGHRILVFLLQHVRLASLQYGAMPILSNFDHNYRAKVANGTIAFTADYVLEHGKPPNLELLAAAMRCVD